MTRANRARLQAKPSLTGASGPRSVICEALRQSAGITVPGWGSGKPGLSGSFNSGKNGNVTGSLTLTPPPPGPTFSCPPGQKQATASVTYTGVSIADTTNGITDAISGVFTTGCLLPDVRGACS